MRNMSKVDAGSPTTELDAYQTLAAESGSARTEASRLLTDQVDVSNVTSFSTQGQ